MKRFGLPAIMLHLMACIMWTYGGRIEQDVAVTQWMSGGGIFKQLANEDGLGAMTYEIRDCQVTQNFCSARGFVEALSVQPQLFYNCTLLNASFYSPSYFTSALYLCLGLYVCVCACAPTDAVMMRMKWQGFSHWDTVCSNWVWVSKSKTGRTPENPMGNLEYRNVRESNLMVAGPRRICE